METVQALAEASLWVYKAEGRANVAFSYGGHDALLLGRVLRVKKRAEGAGVATPRRTLPASNVASATPGTASLPPTDPLAFVREVMTPLLGAEYLIPSVELSFPPSSPFLARLDAVLQACPSRPSSRAGTHVATSDPLVVLMLDHSLLPGSGQTLCVEIKPKSGYPPGRDDPACRYCMHQVAKGLGLDVGQHAGGGGGTAEGATTAGTPHVLLSHYCPLDLYSGEEARVHRALSCLLATPQNNLRLFAQGQERFPLLSTGAREEGVSDGGATDALDALECVLGAHFLDVVESTAPHTRAAATCGVNRPHIAALLLIVCAALCADPLLPRLRSVQGLAGSTASAIRGGMAAYALLAARHLPPVPPVGTASPPSQAEGEAEGETYGGRTATQWASVAGAIADAVSAGAYVAEEEAAAVSTLRALLVAASAKDCSLMCAVQLEGSGARRGGEKVITPLEGGPTPASDEHGRRILSIPLPGGRGLMSAAVSLAVVDLDPKPLGRVPLYWLQEKRIAAAFATLGTAIFARAGKQCTHTPGGAD